MLCPIFNASHSMDILLDVCGFFISKTRIIDKNKTNIFTESVLEYHNFIYFRIIMDKEW